tara:strand:- start:2260 stop:2445 length:186 start_codon:yes stop_codon:yes gene_type:complete
MPKEKNNEYNKVKSQYFELGLNLICDLAEARPEEIKKASDTLKEIWRLIDPIIERCSKQEK